MQQHTFSVFFIVSFTVISVDSRIHRDKLNLYELFQRRKSPSFTTAQHEFQNQMLKEHNTSRSRHCAPPLRLDDDISRSAQRYAEYLASTNKFEHSDAPDVGENIFKMISKEKINHFHGAEATRSLYDEIKDYDFKNPKFSEEIAHFTQVVWKETEKLGVGYTTGKHHSQYTFYAVAQYSPAGNVDDFFSENVLSPEC